MSEQIRREFVLNYPLDKVKKAIEDACKSSAASFQIKNRNAEFNSYSISLVKMLSVLPITVQLKKISEGETGIDLSAVAGPQLSRVPNFVSEMLDTFLAKVGDFVSGRLTLKLQQPAAAENKISHLKAGIIIWIIVVLLVGLIYLLIR